jgi:hypothetical protein
MNDIELFTRSDADAVNYRIGHVCPKIPPSLVMKLLNMKWTK